MRNFMKYLITVLCLSGGLLLAQVPQSINYQAIARDNGLILVNQTIDVRITILDASTSVYQETHSATTDQYGQFKLNIGQGFPITGSFSGILWAGSSLSFQVEIDTGSGFVNLGSRPLRTVPYAFHAQEAVSAAPIGPALGDLSGTFPSPTVSRLQGLSVSPTLPIVGEVLKWSGTQWEPATDNVVATGGVNTTARLSGDGSPGNELDIAQQGATNGQVLKWNGINWSPANDDGTTQTLSLSGSVLTLSNGGGSVNLPGGITAVGPGLDLTGGVLSNTGDTDASDDITNTTSSGGDLSGVYPNPTVIGIQGRNIANNAPAGGEVLKWNGTEWAPAPDNASATPYIGGAGISISSNIITNTGDLDPVDDVNNGDPAFGDLAGVYPNPSVIRLRGNPISPVNPTSGQILKFNAGQWVPSIDEVIDSDSDPLNEIQTLSQSGNTITLSGGGGSAIIPSLSAGPGISLTPTVNGSQINNTGDIDPTNDITNSTVAGGDLAGFYPNPTVSQIQGFSVSTSVPNLGQILKWNGSQWDPSVDLTDDADADPANELQNLSISGNTLSISNGNSVNLPANNWTLTGIDLFYNNGNVGIGTNTPTNELSVNGTSTVVNASNEVRVESGFDAFGGFVNIYDNSNTLKAGIRVDNTGQGEVFGDLKNFRIAHPKEADKEIWYASLEGPEAAAYARGTATLKNGKAEIEFPEHYQLVSQANGMTVMLTPLSGDSKGLAAIEKTEQGFKVVELLGGKGNYAFDWEVKSVRKGHEQFQVIRPSIKK